MFNYGFNLYPDESEEFENIIHRRINELITNANKHMNDDLHQKIVNEDIKFFKTILKKILRGKKMCIKRPTYSGFVTSLKENQVFVFGSNLKGFHGGGSAGFGSFCEAGNNWRKHQYNLWDDGTKGKWNIKGVGVGYQEGTEGRSYALPTVKQAGMPKSLSMTQIICYIAEFYRFAEEHPEMEFLVAYTGNGKNLNGYTNNEMALMFRSGDIPSNVVFEEEFSKLVFPIDLKDPIFHL